MLTEVRGHAAAFPPIEALLLDTTRGCSPADYHAQLWKAMHEAGQFDYA
jgi:hypothetical protein